MDNTTATYDELSAEYDRLMDEVGDFEPEGRAQLAVVLWAMVQADIAQGEDYGEDDVRNYRLAAKAGAKYLARLAAAA